MNKRADIRAAVFCLIAAAAVLLICSMNSYLYPVNPWNDVHCFMTVAREMLAGRIPYRDLIEQKGPLLYGLHALALLVSPGNYHGMYLIEAVLMAGMLFFFYKIARMYAPKINVGWTAVAAMVIGISWAFRFGDSAEELCLFPMAWSLYAALKYLRTGERISMREYLLHGVLAGCILWTKFNLLGFHLAWMGFLAIEALIADRNLKRPVGMCLWFLGGMALASAPWLVYFGVNGALGDLLRVYFGMNIHNYGVRNYNPLLYMCGGVLRGLWDLRSSLLIIVAAVGVLFARKKQMAWKEKGFLICAAVVMAYAIYGRGIGHIYYFIPFFLFLPMGAVVLSWIARLVRWEKIGSKRAVSAMVCVVLMCVGVTGALKLSGKAGWIGHPYEETNPGRVAAMIGDDEEDLSILNVNDLDGGYYFSTGAEVPSEWFCRLNLLQEECREEQMRCLREDGVDYAIVTDAMLEEWGPVEGYELIGEVSEAYGGLSNTVRIYKNTGA